ncbi:MAG: GGDEF domain-containing protein [Oscillospiraceae bacterium]
MIGEYKIIALCLSKIHDSTSHELTVELNKAVSKFGYRVFVYNTCSDLYWNTVEETGEASVFELMDFSIIDAVVIFDDRLKNKSVLNKIIGQSHDADIPVFIIDGQGYYRCINVKFDYEKGFEKVVRHIICEHGIHDIHFISGIENNPFSETRTEVLRRVMAENGLPFTDDMISYGQFWSEPTIAAVEKLITKNRLPRAIICANDSMAIAASETLRKHGYCVPNDIAVTGFDGIEEIFFCQPAITSCKCSYADIASIILSLLPKCENDRLRSGEYYVVPQLIVAESCGCAEHFNMDYADYISRVSDRFHRYQEEEHSLMQLSTKVQTSESFAHASEHIKQHNKVIYNACILLNRNCIDSTVNLLELPECDTHFNEKMYLFFDAESNSQDENRNIMLKEIVPELDRKLNSGYPLIFTALNYSSVPLGYVCFTFYSYSIANYYKISQTCSILNNAVGGLHNLQYLRFLAGKVEQTYRLDALTGLNNRISFARDFEKMIMNLPPDTGITVVMADLDRLKYINDTFGHDEGDIAIKAVADALKTACPEGAILARFGGDEMLGVIASEVDRFDIRAALDGFLSEHNTRMGKPYEVSASLGVYVTSPDEELVLEELVKKTDRLMYNEKARKKAMFANNQS